MGKIKNINKELFLVPIVLIILFIFGLYLRTLSLPENMLFGYEQGRDALVTRDILSLKKLTLLGPKTDIDGIYHGAFYYYFLSGVYAITQGNPATALFIFTIINCLTVVLIYFIAREIIRNISIRLFASGLAAISFNIIIYGRWLSNVSPSIFVVSCFFIFLIKFVKTEKLLWFLLLNTTIGLLAHFELLHFLYAGILALIVISYNKIHVPKKWLMYALVCLAATLSPFIVFDLRHEFLLTKGLIHYISSQSLSQKPLPILFTYLEGLVEEIVSTLNPKNGMLILLFISYMVYLYVKKIPEKMKDSQLFFLLCTSLFWTFPYIFLLKWSTLNQFYAGTSIVVILFFCFLLDRTYTISNKLIVSMFLIFMVIGNITYVKNALASRDNIFYHMTQKDYIYKDQLAVMDYIYTNSESSFDFDAFTIPYYHREAWNYLYNWHGQKIYPEKFAFNEAEKNRKMLYLIIEPSTASVWLSRWLAEYDKSSSLLKTEKIGSIVLQVRSKQ